MSWYCIGTNLLSAAPAYELITRGDYTDAIITCCTGMASFLFHGEELHDWNMKFIAIRNTDVIMANVTIILTINYLLWRNRRFEIVLWVLPALIYLAELSIFVRFLCTGVYALLCIGMVMKNRQEYIMHYFVGGCIIIAIDVICFIYGNKLQYEWLHGTHHVCAFTSQYLFLCSTCKVE